MNYLPSKWLRYFSLAYKKNIYKLFLKGLFKGPIMIVFENIVQYKTILTNSSNLYLFQIIPSSNDFFYW